MARREFRQMYPQPGWVEHDPMEIWQSQIATAREAIAKAGLCTADIAGIGITSQRETTVMWRRRTGQPVCNAIVRKRRRSAPWCETLRAQGHESLFRAETGLVLDACFSGTRLRWILDHVPGARAAAERGELAFGTVDGWLIWNLTGGAVHATDVSNASRTLMLDIRRNAWDDELLGALGVPRSLLPRLQPSSGDFGRTVPDLLGASLPIGGVAGDRTSMFGIARSDAGISTGWCFGPLRPMPIESWLKTNFTGRPISAAMRIAGRSWSENARQVTASGTMPPWAAMPFAIAPITCSRTPQCTEAPRRSRAVKALRRRLWWVGASRSAQATMRSNSERSAAGSAATRASQSSRSARPRRGFAQAHPDISLNLSAAHTHSDFALGQADIDIRYGVPQWGDLVVEPLFEERIVPLASPAFIREHRLKRIEQLVEVPLIQSNVSVVQWSDWLQAFAGQRAPERYALRFDRAQMSLDAATQGLGVAPESATNAGLHLADGKLEPVFGLDKAIRVKAHFVVHPARHARRPPVEAFLAWIRGEAARTEGSGAAIGSMRELAPAYSRTTRGK